MEKSVWLCGITQQLPIHENNLVTLLEERKKAAKLAMMNPFSCLYLRALLFLAIANSLLAAGFGAEPEKVTPKHIVAGAKDMGDLTDREYLMRKATLGSRAERIEALDVIKRSNDPALLTFLLERLQKEDDHNIQITIMHALSSEGDVRAILPLRRIARWDDSRVGIEATIALYELGDDYYMPRLILKLKVDEDSPELTGMAHRALRRMTGEDYPPSQRTWMNYYYTHQLHADMQASWYWPFAAPLPKTVDGKVAGDRPKGKARLPDHDIQMRHTHITYSDWWKTEEP